MSLSSIYLFAIIIMKTILCSVARFLKSSKCDKKIYIPVEEIKARIPPTNGEETPKTESHYLRSVDKNKVSHICFSFKEFATQLLEFGEDLFYSSLVSTDLDCLDWVGKLLSLITSVL